MATIKEIAEIVGVSCAAVSRVLNYDEEISVSQDTRAAIFRTAEKVGYKKKVIYPKIENVVLLYWVYHEEELEDIYYQNIRTETVRIAKKMNMSLKVITKEEGLQSIPPDINAFIAIGWMNRKELDELYKICSKGVFIDTSPDEKRFDAVRPNLDSFVTQIVDYYIEKGHKAIGFIGSSDRDINTEKPSMDIREWSFRQSMIYYGILNEKYIKITEKLTVSEGYKLTNDLIKSNNLPTALCVASDTLAVGVLQALNELSIKVPEQVAVFSINDINVAKYLSPPLTSIHVDVPMICETAIDLIRDKILKDHKLTKMILINGNPVFRKSC